MSMQHQTLADRIRRCAELAGSGDELSRKTAIPRRTLESYLAGESEPKASRIVAIAAAVGVSVEWLLTGQEPRQLLPQAPHSPGDEERAPDSAAPGSGLDEDFIGQVGELVELLYRQEGARPSARELVQVSARLYGQACRVGPDPAERLGALKLLIEQERTVLRTAAKDPKKSKSSA